MNKQAALESFRAIPEKSLGKWRYRVFGAGARTFLCVPGGELVNDLGFEFALAIGKTHRVIYPGYPRASTIEELSDGLRAILDVEGIAQVAILGASFGGAVAQVFVRRHPDRVTELILSNTGVPLQYLARPVRITCWIFKMMPWGLTSKLLRKPLLKTVDQSSADHTFWARYLDELCSTRLTKADVLSNMLIQHDYHCRFHFAPEDLKDWHGSVLIAESDTDVIGPRRRKALRDTYPQAEVHTFHNAGHGPMFTRYDEYLQMVQDFLKSRE
jgi:pimeloyl-ACP methyl ester carboxylesterase